jgi:hypothetical protein
LKYADKRGWMDKIIEHFESTERDSTSPGRQHHISKQSN